MMSYYPSVAKQTNIFCCKQGNSGKFAKLIKSSLEYLGPVDLREYFVKSYTVLDDDEELRASTHGNTGIKVNFIFSRRLLNQLLTVFMPTMCIVVVSFCASFFKVFSGKFCVMYVHFCVFYIYRLKTLKQ